MSPRSMEALRAGINSLSSNRRRALEVLRMATDDDPGMADAWLGRIAAGDRSLATLQELSNAAARLGQDLRNVGAFVEQLDVSFDVGYVRWRIDDTTSARLAYAAALIAEQHYDKADAVLGELGRSHRVLYTRAQLLNDTERWTDLLSTVIGCEAWTEDHFLQRAASLLEAKAAANLGMFDRATAAVARAAECSSPQGDPVVRDATYLRGLIARCQGNEDTARQLLADVAARWPDYQPARDALTDPTHSLHIIDQQTIDSRTAHWDPSTQTTPKQREANEQASDARQQLADAEATLAKMVGLDDVKKQVSALKAMTAARILRQRKGIPTEAVSNHMLMVGPPGVGKTETARAIAKVFCGLGILAKPNIYEASREKLSGRHIGDLESNTRDFLDTAVGATVFFDEFGELVHGGIAGGDPIGQAIIGGLVPWMEDNRDKAVLIAAGYPRACERVLETNGGLRGRFATTIAFDSYPPDKLIAIAEVIITRTHFTVQPGVLQEILLEPFTRFYTHQERTPDGDIVRRIDLLNNGRFVRNIVEAAERNQALRVMSDLGIDNIDLLDESFGADVSKETMSLLTRDDIHVGLQEALPPGLRTGGT